GSRFGYRKGVTKRDRLNEEQDKDAVRRAILGEGVNPNAMPDSPRRRVAWNELPAALAVDVWREYAAKFTRDQLFEPTQLVPPPSPPPLQPTEEEIDPLSQPLQVSGSRDNMQDGLTRMIRELNRLMARAIRLLEGKKEDPKLKRTIPPPALTTEVQVKKEPQRKTAIQVINEMVKARLTQEEVDFLDDNGVRGQGKIPSPEYRLLKDRGLAVRSVSIGSLRFDPEIEETIIQRWSATWLNNAKQESELVERKRSLVEAKGSEKAIRQYADFFSKDLIQKKPVGIKETLKNLLLRTRTLIINSHPLRQRMTDEQQDLENIIRWTEGAG
ncbi:MAG TPA: hypothetical protein VGK56_18710, partial [Anaerolineales bacterium]